MNDIKPKRAPKAVTINYQNGKIYKIVNDVNDMTYIGATTTTLSRRLSQHKTSALKARIYDAFRDIGFHHFTIVLIENFPCTTKDHLSARQHAIVQTYSKDLLYNTKIHAVVEANIT